MMNFFLVRERDVSGVSGTGVVAEGVVFRDKTVALRWRGEPASTAVWADLDAVVAVHGHNGATTVMWAGDARVAEAFEEVRQLHDRWGSTDVDDLDYLALWEDLGRILQGRV